MYGIPPSEHADLSEYECHAFPDDAYQLDQLLVALISIAIAIPTGMFLGRCFEIANEGEDWPDAWLELPRGWIKLAAQALYGEHYHGRWHYSTAIEGDEDSAVQLKRRSLSHSQQSFGSRSHGPGEALHDDTVDGGIVGIVRQSITSIMHKVKGHSKVVPPCRSDLVLWYVRHSYEMHGYTLMGGLEGLRSGLIELSSGLSVGVEFHNKVVRLLPLCDGFHICPASLLIDLGVQSWNKTTAESRLLARLQLSLTLLALLVLRLHLLQLLLLSNTSFL